VFIFQLSVDSTLNIAKGALGNQEAQLTVINHSFEKLASVKAHCFHHSLVISIHHTFNVHIAQALTFLTSKKQGN